MKVRARQESLPEVELESTLADDRAAGGVAVRSDDRRLPWGWIAAGAVALVLVLIVSGPGGDNRQQANPATPTTRFAPPITSSPALTSEAAVLGSGSVWATIEMRWIERGENDGAVRVDFSGSGGSPDRRYWMQLGVCPSLDAIAGASTGARSDGTFAGSIETLLLPGAPVWLSVLDERGTSFGVVQGRLFQGEFTLVPEGTTPCGAVFAFPDTRVKIRALETTEQFAARRATISPVPIAADIMASETVMRRANPLGEAELLLGQFALVDTDLVVDPAWVLIDRRGSVYTVKVFDARTGRLVQIFSGKEEPVTCPIDAGAAPTGCVP